MHRVCASHNMVLLGRTWYGQYHALRERLPQQVRFSRADQRVRTIITLGVSAYHKVIRRRGQRNQVRTTITPRVCAYHNMVRLTCTASGYGQLTRRV